MGSEIYNPEEWMTREAAATALGVPVHRLDGLIYYHSVVQTRKIGSARMVRRADIEGKTYQELRALATGVPAETVAA